MKSGANWSCHHFKQFCAANFLFFGQPARSLTKKGWTDVLLNTVCLSNTRGHPDTAFPI